MVRNYSIQTDRELRNKVVPTRHDSDPDAAAQTDGDRQHDRPVQMGRLHIESQLALSARWLSPAEYGAGLNAPAALGGSGA